MVPPSASESNGPANCLTAELASFKVGGRE
jgi:hypothetical protein